MTDAARALALSHRARERGDVDECLRAAALAQGHAAQDREPDVGWRALTCMGILYRGRGEPEKARPWYLMAMEHAKLHGLTQRMAGSAHDLYVTACEMGDEREQRRFQPIALELYKPFDRRLGTLLSDFALNNLRDGRDAAYARLLWLGVHAEAKEPTLRLIAATWLVVASAHMSVERYYRDALWMLASACAGQAGEAVAVSLNRACEAMLHRGDFERAYSVAESAELAATVRGEALQRERAAWLKDRADAARGVRMR